MKLSFQNIGKVAKADIEVNAITVITGANDTGKSTVGKLLYGIYTAFNLLTPRYLMQCKMQSIMDDEERVYRFISKNEFTDDEQSGFRNQYPTYYVLPYDESQIEALESALEELVLKWIKILNSKVDHIETSDDSRSPYIREKIETICNSMLNKLKIPSKNMSVELSAIEDVLLSIFSGSITTEIGEELAGIIRIVEDNNDSLSLKFFKNKMSIEESQMQKSRFFNPVLYIDNPFVLNNLNPNDTRDAYESFPPEIRYRPDTTLSLALNALSTLSPFDKVLQNNVLQVILSTIIPGEIRKSEGKYKYYSDEFKSPITVENLSTGMKAFGIFKMLLTKNSLLKYEMLVLDEPEIHLHPEWQLKYAEFIVLLAKEHQLRVLITSHSPYFVDAIEQYSKKHTIYDEVRFYKTKSLETGMSEIVDVTGDLEYLYEDMARPFRVLEELEGEINER